MTLHLRSLSGSTHTTATLWAFFLLHLIGGHLALPALLLISWARESVGRGIVFHNFIFTWILYSAAFCLLLYANQHVGPEPNWGLCLVQSAFVYAVPVLVSTSLLALAFQLWLDSRAPQPIRTDKVITTRTALLTFAPYILASGFIIFPILVGVGRPASVSRESSFFYCSTNVRGLAIASAITAFVILTVVAVLEVLIARKMMQYRTITSSAVNRKWTEVRFFIRIAVFTGYLFLSMVACALAIASPKNIVRVMIQATGPLFVFIIFGSSPDFYRTKSNNTF